VYVDIPWQWSISGHDVSWLQETTRCCSPLGNRCPLTHVSDTLPLSWSNSAVAFSTYGGDQQPSNNRPYTANNVEFGPCLRAVNTDTVYRDLIRRLFDDEPG